MPRKFLVVGAIFAHLCEPAWTPHGGQAKQSAGRSYLRAILGEENLSQQLSAILWAISLCELNIDIFELSRNHLHRIMPFVPTHLTSTAPQSLC
jgi:hypothetical protein